MMLGFNTLQVAPGATETFDAQVQLAFQPRSIIIAASHPAAPTPLWLRVALWLTRWKWTSKARWALANKFKPREPSAMDHIAVVDIIVDNHSQFVAAGEVPASAFSAETPFNMGLELDRAKPGDELKVIVHHVCEPGTCTPCRVAVAMNGVAFS